MVDAELRDISVRHTVFSDYDFSETVDDCRKNWKFGRKPPKFWAQNQAKWEIWGSMLLSTVYMVRGKQKMRYFTDLVFKCFKICGFIWLPRYSK